MVAWSRMITWPLFSPPRFAPVTSIPSRMYLSPTGVRTTCPPTASSAASRPPFERTVTTRMPPVERPAGQPIEGAAARAAGRRRRPGRGGRPRPAGRRRRRARNPRSAPAGDDLPGEVGRRRRAAADVDVLPVRLVVDHLDPGAGRGQDLRGRHAARAVGAVEHDVQVGTASRRPGARRSATVAVDERRTPSTSRPMPPLRGPPSSSVRQISCSSGPPRASSSLRPRPSSTLRPLSSAGLWEAETMIPAANVAVPARKASAGVGRTPASWTSAPRLAAPGRDGRHEHLARAAGVPAHDQASPGADELDGRSPSPARRRPWAAGRRWRRRGSRRSRRAGPSSGHHGRSRYAGGEASATRTGSR